MEPFALTRLREQRLVAVIRAPDAAAALGAARAVAAGGVRIVEITFTVPDALRVMTALRDEPGLTVGAGTVLTAAQARAALAAGACFLIAPNLSREVADEAAGAGVFFCPGAYTTTEIVAARAAGFRAQRGADLPEKDRAAGPCRDRPFRGKPQLRGFAADPLETVLWADQYLRQHGTGP